MHVTSVRTVHTARSKFVPQYDSAVPLNPWSKVSMSGYMVARVKKTLPAVVDREGRTSGRVSGHKHVGSRAEWRFFPAQSWRLV